MDNIRQLALETIVTLAETAPGLVRKQKQLIPVIGKNDFVLWVSPGVLYWHNLLKDWLNVKDSCTKLCGGK